MDRKVRWCACPQNEREPVQHNAHCAEQLGSNRSRLQHRACGTGIFNHQLPRIHANFRQFRTVSRDHIEPLRKQGFERIVYIAYRAQGGASEILSIDRQATDLGLSYVHMPVPWQSPTLRDYQTFAAIMRSQPTMKTLLHCQMNYRASAFSFLYRVLELDTPMPTAAADLYQIWSPNSTWMTFINSVLVTNNRPILDTP